MTPLWMEGVRRALRYASWLVTRHFMTPAHSCLVMGSCGVQQAFLGSPAAKSADIKTVAFRMVALVSHLEAGETCTPSVRVLNTALERLLSIRQNLRSKGGAPLGRKTTWARVDKGRSYAAARARQ